MPLHIERNDITKVKADAIVNTANPKVAVGRGVDHAIYETAGRERLLKERRKIGVLRPGEVALTPAFDLPAKYIIHASSCYWEEAGSEGPKEILAACYRKSLAMARDHGCESIAVPLMATGSYGFPKEVGLDIALSEINRFLMENDEMDVHLVVYDDAAFGLSKKLTDDVASYIDAHYVEEKRQEYRGSMGYGEGRTEERRAGERNLRRFRAYDEEGIAATEPSAADKKTALAEILPESGVTINSISSEFLRKAVSLDELLKNSAETFEECLFRLIDKSGLKDSDVYKRANVSRQVFSKIRCKEGYMPKKKTIFAFALALSLGMDDARDLLRSAGLTFLPSSKTDIIVQYCISHGIYDVNKVNALLFDYGLPTLDE